MTGSSLDLSCAIDHDGVIRRSEEEAVEVIRSGISRAVFKEGGGMASGTALGMSDFVLSVSYSKDSRIQLQQQG